jgi:hypothetical protein
MVNTHNGRADADATQSNGPPPLPPTLAQVITSILESREEQTELLHLFVTNSTRGGIVAGNAHGQAQSTYAEFLATHPSTLFVVQQLLSAARPWWANCTTTRPTDQVQWAKFHEAFWAQYIPACIMLRKHQEFMDLKQCGRTMYDYSKLFNHLAQYAPEQVDIDAKKMACFMKGLSTKLKERLPHNTAGTFPELMSNAIITDDSYDRTTSGWGSSPGST